MYKLLVNAPTGEQKIENISQSGQYFDLTRIVWDERKDGVIPANITLGKMIKNGAVLDTLTDYLPDHDAWMAERKLTIATETKKKAIDTEIKNDGDLALLREMGGVEIDTWFDANVMNANQCIKLLKKVVKSLVKRGLL